MSHASVEQGVLSPSIMSYRGGDGRTRISCLPADAAAFASLVDALNDAVGFYKHHHPGFQARSTQTSENGSHCHIEVLALEAVLQHREGLPTEELQAMTSRFHEEITER